VEFNGGGGGYRRVLAGGDKTSSPMDTRLAHRRGMGVGERTRAARDVSSGAASTKSDRDTSDVVTCQTPKPWSLIRVS
jgi:hypothetical protein